MLFSLTQSQIQKFDVDLVLQFGPKNNLGKNTLFTDIFAFQFHRQDRKIDGTIHKSKKSICTIR